MKTRLSAFIIVAFAAVSLHCSTLRADEPNKTYATPFQLSFFAPIQLAPMDSDVYGLRLCLPYGVNRKFYGLDIGLWTSNTGWQRGLQIGGLTASRDGLVYGLSIGGLINLSSGKEYGVA